MWSQDQTAQVVSLILIYSVRKSPSITLNRLWQILYDLKAEMTMEIFANLFKFDELSPGISVSSAHELRKGSRWFDPGPDHILSLDLWSSVQHDSFLSDR